MILRLSAKAKFITLGVLASFLGNVRASQAVTISNTEQNFKVKELIVFIKSLTLNRILSLKNSTSHLTPLRIDENMD
ncbi:MAG: hypothetical protein AAFX80_19190 [Cyanobacteria bacterium J06639_18]